MRIWSILLIKSDLKWCIHLSRSLFLYHITTQFEEPNNEADEENMRNVDATDDDINIHLLKFKSTIKVPEGFLVVKGELRFLGKTV